MAYNEDTNAPLIITIGAVAGIVLVVLAIGVQAWFLYEEGNELDSKWAATQNTKLIGLREEQRLNVSGYRWIDKQKQIAAVPIDEAMKMVEKSGGKLPQ